MRPAFVVRRTLGFTLIELMMVVAIIAIIAAVAYPSYQNHVLRTRRASAAACLEELAQQMERRYATSMRYNVTTTLPTLSCVSDLDRHYSFAYASGEPTTSTFIITATPTGAQAADTRCGVLGLNHQGVRFAQETGTATALVSACWR